MKKCAASLAGFGGNHFGSPGARLCTCEFSTSDVEAQIIRINVGRPNRRADAPAPTQARAGRVGVARTPPREEIGVTEGRERCEKMNDSKRRRARREIEDLEGPPLAPFAAKGGFFTANEGFFTANEGFATRRDCLRTRRAWVVSPRVALLKSPLRRPLRRARAPPRLGSPRVSFIAAGFFF